MSVFQNLRISASVLAAFAAIAWLWLTLVNHLRIEWSVNPQYAYGWAVPFLCAYLLYERLKRAKLPSSIFHLVSPKSDRRSADNNFSISAFQLSAFVFLAFLYLPVRLVEEANPEWRLVSWALALITIGITLLMLGMAVVPKHRSTGAPKYWQPFQPFQPFSFPVLFFLVAVPWPTVIEGPLVQALTRANAGVTIEILNLIGIPALQHGNLIEVGTGVVGIDEACSGIRSFQATLMIALFFGELYRLKRWSRTFLVVAGFTLSFVFNVIRTTLLTGVAARDGVEAIAKWHDPAGVTILVACFLALWGLSMAARWEKPAGGVLKGSESTTEAPKAGSPHLECGDPSPPFSGGDLSPTLPDRGPALQSADRSAHSHASPDRHFSISAFQVSAFAVLAWLLASEVAVEAWYRSHERNLPDPVTWTVNWPESNPTFEERPLSEKTEQFLRFDEGRDASWIEEDGRRWQVIFLRWNPGRTAVHLAKGHTPETCLAAVGYEPEVDPELAFIDVNGLSLPFRHYTLNTPGTPTHVYYCLWEDRAEDHRFDVMGLSYANRLEPVLAGRRLTGQRSLEVVVTGISNPAAAEAALRKELSQLIQVQ